EHHEIRMRHRQLGLDPRLELGGRADEVGRRLRLGGAPARRKANRQENTRRKPARLHGDRRKHGGFPHAGGATTTRKPFYGKTRLLLSRSAWSNSFPHWQGSVPAFAPTPQVAARSLAQRRARRA